MYAAGGKVTVNGGTVNATGYTGGAGIGSGKNGAGGEVTVTGGTVNATGGYYAAGIGGGMNGDGSMVKITGGRVYAQANGGSAQAIGRGDGTSFAGRLEIYAGAKVSAGVDDSSASPVEETGGTTARVDACRDNEYAAIEPCESHSYTKYKITDTTRTPVCAYCLNEGTATPHAFVNHKCVCGKEQQKATVTTLPTARKWVSDGNAQALAQAGAAEGGEMRYALGTETAPGTDWSDAIPERTDAETYYVWYKAQGDAAHLDSEPKPVSAGITPKSIIGATVTLEKNQMKYTGAEQTVAVTGVTIDGLTLTADDYTVTGNTGTNAADYTVTVTGKGNFQDTATAGWKIVEAGMTLSAPDVSAAYDGQPHGIAVTVSEPAGAVIKFKDEAGAYTLNASPAITNAGSLVVGNQVTADNYLPVTGSATVTVTPKAATVTALEQTVKEGESIQTGTDFATLTDALSGHTLSAVTLTAENGKIVPSAAKILDAKGNDVIGNHAVTYTPATLITLGKISHLVTFKVVNGAWDDGTTEDQTVALSGFAGDALKLAAADIPAVGAKPGDAYKAGAWDVVPSAEAEVLADTTYTYTYADKDAISQTVTFKVVNGSWDDGTTADKVVTLNGLEGDTLKLTAEQIPAVGGKPNGAFKAGSWDVTPNPDTVITEATTYTYTYALRDAYLVTVTNDGHGAGSASPNSGYEGTEVLLTAAPKEGYKTKYVNVGVYEHITDRCCDGGTIINKKIPKTGDEEPLLLWAGMIALGAVGLTAALVIGKKRKANQ